MQEERLYLKNLVKLNANRNQRDPDPNDKNYEGGLNTTLLGPHKLSKSQMKLIYDLIDRRQRAIAKSELPLSTYVK